MYYKIRIIFIIALLFPVVIYCQNDSIKTQDNHKISWESIFFESINRRINESSLEVLSTKLLSKDEIELRIWILPSFSPAKGYIIKGNNKGWSAIYVKPISYFLSPIGDIIYSITGISIGRKAKIKEVTPKTNWNYFINKLNLFKIKELPDEDELVLNEMGLDGTVYVVEIKEGENYRTYHYCNPENFDNIETICMSEIINLVLKEFK